MKCISRIAIVLIIAFSIPVVEAIGVYKVPISHSRVGIVQRGEVLKSATVLQDELIINGVRMKFKEGRLVDGDDGNIPVSIKKLWRRHPGAKIVADNWWRDSNRLKLWFFNPNGAGTLFAELAITFLSLLLFVAQKLVFKVIFSLLSLTSAGLIFLTGSRGSLVAMIVGCVVLLISWGLLRKVRLRVFVFSSLSAVLALLSVLFISGERFGKNLVALDESNQQRIQAWMAVPEMLAAAPGGWGEYPGIAYDEWFQDEDDRHVLYYLVNTHLTWMVANGRWFSIAYVALWVLLFVLMILHVRDRRNVLALGVWVTFFVANWFSTIGIFKSLWILPVLLALVASPTWFSGIRTPMSFMCRIILPLAGSIICAVILVRSLEAVGHVRLAARQVPVRRVRGITYVGKGKNVVHVVPDQWVLSRYEYGGMGRDIRAWCVANPDAGSVAVVDSLYDIPQKCDRLVLIGRSARDYIKFLRDKESDKEPYLAKSTVFVSPPLKLRSMPETICRAMNLEVYEGEFLAEVSGDMRVRKDWLHIVPGCELYIPQWVELAMGTVKR